MLSLTQYLVGYYLLAVHDYGLHALGMAPGGETPAFLNMPNKITGHECYWTLIWCKTAYGRNDPAWWDLKLPCRLTFIRMLKSLKIQSNQSWRELERGLSRNMRAHLANIRKTNPTMIKSVEAQLKRYRHHKTEAHLYQRVASYS